MRILLGVSGSISAYKSLDIARGLVKKGHEVKVILTEGALKFVVPEVFTYLGVSDVYKAQDDFVHKNVLHIDLARWCDVFAIAPVSANTLSRLAQGQASDLLSSVFLALEPHKNTLIFPAMNTNMLHHPFTEKNIEDIKKLKTLNNLFVSPTDAGILACEEVGLGKLPNVDEIIEIIPTMIKPIQSADQKTILVTTGATIVPLDPVRYLTNSSSGITGYYLAEAALSMGHKVVMIAGAHSTAKLNLYSKHPNFKLLRAKTVEEMKDAVHSHLNDADLYISSAAISDIEFDVSDSKIKKDSMGDSLKIKPATDVLKTVLEKKSAKLKVVGFAAETDPSDSVLNKKMQSKPVDLLVGTKVNNGLTKNQEVTGFNADFAEYRLLSPKGFTYEGILTKKELAHKIILQFFPPN
ncbi:bifunctional phosphopantothenoylcysteine decarboxylase/phosphopantothenate--cysteine ligase CoaBC [Bacteriovorax stolpii]|uniref:Coenzyme A biosynthesis bifunctional protein CoaBC n=1 Tax=Bacteriovorax stolpii TaxID=960 RepID=A0A2K9NX83_BACTC|nr:bifunctional phosphopantothenoylcysteine decarboxylase/phosphopantothenate--cysteine ligase CoaBC [Bacteriovorax stolpii]AUN99384.1 bifunctional phosphopantothenoylcysteine decarboxylase/phosphopantothenate--cysteine ligase CoaBC [Bacteriovorax stolpii]QDK40636.1 bifunctional phosphopantothenoylcysteine decarboxylase/phosphopantothenate--cysteine ligase CoaBC [Bacteriovorax stolpii]TDP55074.1 phosphopantothenoylcysteine decarboxylase/phosphopantothenate--cysteine ligase [Bacteriovorax stolpii